MTPAQAYRLPRLGPHVWGLSLRYLAICPWNGEDLWIQLPLVYFGIGTKHVELGLGRADIYLSFEIRWRW